jgi:hypothetical protein
MAVEWRDIGIMRDCYGVRSTYNCVRPAKTQTANAPLPKAPEAALNAPLPMHPGQQRTYAWPPIPVIT